MVKDCGKLGWVLQYNPADELRARTLDEHVNTFSHKPKSAGVLNSNNDNPSFFFLLNPNFTN